jgi:HK97 family phage major capsid protein/HK97 family phage prohead protease
MNIKKLQINKKFTRDLIFESVGVKEENIVVFSFSSELPVKRDFGLEILSHEEEAVDFSRFKDGAPFLYNHDTADQIGVIEDAWIGEDRKGYIKVRFSKEERAQSFYRDVVDGIRKNISVGYQIKRYIVDERIIDDEEIAVVTVTVWEPYESSLTPVPADPKVGLRALESGDPDEEGKVEDDENKGEKADDISDEDEENAEEAEDIKKKILDIQIKNSKEYKKMEVKDYKEIMALGKRFGCIDLAEKAVESDMPVEQFRMKILDEQERKSKENSLKGAPIGMSAKEVQNFSIIRAINALANPMDSKAQKVASFEIEASRAYAERIGSQVENGICIPPDVCMRDFNLTTGTGANLVATDHRADMFIDSLKNRMLVAQLGAQVMPGLVGDVEIPKLTASATGYWINSESGTITDSNPTVGQVTLSPITVGCAVPISRKLLLQGTPAAEQLVRNDMNSVIALMIDQAALKGVSPAPVGIFTYTGVASDYLTVANQITWAEAVAMETDIELANAATANCAYVMATNLKGYAKTTERTSANGIYIWENNEVNGYKAFSTNQLANGEIVFGDFSQLLIGLWSGLTLVVDPYTAASSGKVKVTIMQDADIALRHATAFSVLSNNPIT